MKVTTTYAGPKPFTWSYSRLKNFESCPKKHWHVDLAKDAKEDESDELKWGNLVHGHLAARIGKNIPLPKGFEQFEEWAKRVSAGDGVIAVEQKLAITKEFAACGYFHSDVWFRGVGDVIKINGPVGLIVDWKTGKVLEDSQQLALSAACVFAAYPEVKRIRSEFIWLKHNATTSATFSRDDIIEMWQGLWPRIEQLRQAHETMSYPAKPGGLCKRWCPVKQCPHHGE